MSNLLQNIIGDYITFLTLTFKKLYAEGFELSDFVQLDVLCYRTATQENYNLKKQQLASVGTLLSEVMVSGRPIATFKLHQPIHFQNWRIDTIELPAPKADSEKPEGLEHVQFVLFDNLQTFMQKHNTKEFDTRAIARGVNPMIAYKFAGGGSVKFHMFSLATAIYLETKLGLTKI